MLKDPPMIGLSRHLHLSLLVLFAIGTCIPLGQALSEQPLGKQDVAVLTLTVEDNGKHITGRVGDQIAIELSENPTTGFVWRVDPLDGHVTQVATEFTPAGGGLLGAGGKRVFVFRLEKAGEATISMALKRNWQEGETAAAEHFAITIGISEKVRQ